MHDSQALLQSAWSAVVLKLQSKVTKFGLWLLQEGDPSHALYVKERQNLLDSLHRRASQLYKALNELEGITCNEPEGALYCMPRIRLSKKVLEVSSTSSTPRSLLFCFA